MARMFLNGALGGIRTPDTLVRSQVLYPLSYERARGGPAQLTFYSTKGGGWLGFSDGIIYRNAHWWVVIAHKTTRTVPMRAGNKMYQKTFGIIIRSAPRKVVLPCLRPR